MNPVVTECNDGGLNDIRGFHVTEEDVLEALRKAEESGEEFEEGAVGGGRGMRCLGFKGGIGSASRVLTLDGEGYTVGSIVMANFGSAKHLTVGGVHLGEELQGGGEAGGASDAGRKADASGGASELRGKPMRLLHAIRALSSWSSERTFRSPLASSTASRGEPPYRSGAAVRTWETAPETYA